MVRQSKQGGSTVIEFTVLFAIWWSLFLMGFMLLWILMRGEMMCYLAQMSARKSAVEKTTGAASMIAGSCVRERTSAAGLPGSQRVTCRPSTSGDPWRSQVAVADSYAVIMPRPNTGFGLQKRAFGSETRLFLRAGTRQRDPQSDNDV